MKTYDVDPDKLAQVFDNTTATYKYYWFLALLEQIREGKAYQIITFAEMVAAMISKAYAPITSGQFTFGKCDALIKRTMSIIYNSELKACDVEERVRTYIIEHSHEPLIKDIIDKMTKYVPYRFLYPWIGTMTNGETATASQDFETNKCPYAIVKKAIRLNPAWVQYFSDHLTFFEDFGLLELQRFLMAYNENIFMADNETIAAGGYSTSYSSQMGFAAESVPEYGKKPQYAELEKKYKQTLRELNEMKNNLRKVLSIVHPSNIFNFGPSTQIDNHDGGNVTNA